MTLKKHLSTASPPSQLPYSQNTKEKRTNNTRVLHQDTSQCVVESSRKKDPQAEAFINAGAAFVETFFSNPLWYLRVLLFAGKTPPNPLRPSNIPLYMTGFIPTATFYCSFMLVSSQIEAYAMNTLDPVPWLNTNQKKIIASLFGVVIGSLIGTPFEIICVNMSTSSKTRPGKMAYFKMFQVGRELLKRHGPIGFFKGITRAWMRDGLFFFLYLNGKELMKTLIWGNPEHELSDHEDTALTLLTGFLIGLVTAPPDSGRVKIQDGLLPGFRYRYRPSPTRYAGFIWRTGFKGTQRLWEMWENKREKEKIIKKRTYTPRKKLKWLPIKLRWPLTQHSPALHDSKFPDRLFERPLRLRQLTIPKPPPLRHMTNSIIGSVRRGGPGALARALGTAAGFYVFSKTRDALQTRSANEDEY